MMIPQTPKNLPWNPSSHDILEEEAPESLLPANAKELNEDSQSDVLTLQEDEPVPDRESQLEDRQTPRVRPPIRDFDIE